MGQAPRDPNRVPTGLLWDSDNSVTLAWKADTATGRALMFVSDPTPPTPTPAGPPAKRDANYVPAIMALVDGTTDTLIPIACDSDGNMVVTINFE